MLTKGQPGGANAPAGHALTIQDLRLQFGGIKAVDGATFRVRDGSVTGLIGPNGAGKTSLFNCISRLYQATAGTIMLYGEEISRRRPSEIRRLGIARTFQNIALVQEQTVMENVMTGGHVRGPSGFLRSIATWRRRQERSLVAEADHWCERLGLTEVRRAYPSDLPYGTQKRVELARAMMGDPRVLLADEPATGLTHGEVAEFAATLRQLADELSLSILVVEHHMGLVNSICDDVVVMTQGKVLATGTPQEIGRDPRVVEAYLGAAS